VETLNRKVKRKNAKTAKFQVGSKQFTHSTFYDSYMATAFELENRKGNAPTRGYVV
jgi:hypothetical protein